MLHANWQSFFSARADNELGSKNTSIYTKAWSSNKSDDVRIQTLISDINKVIFAADQDKHIHALHSFKVAGGTILRPTTKLMCLLGMGSSATAFIIDKQSLLNPCNLVTPTIEKLQECSKEDEGNAVNAPDDGPEDPPLSFQLLGIQTWSCPREHAAVKPAAIKFDAKHTGDTSYIATAADRAADFILWAWGAGKGRAAATKMTFDPNDNNLE